VTATRVPSVGVADQIVVSSTFEQAIAQHQWRIPDRYNISVDCLTRWASDPTTADRPGLLWARADGEVDELSWVYLDRQVNRVANVLTNRFGIGRGDVVGVLLAQRPETAICHMAIYRIGAILLPLSKSYAGRALSYRLEHGGAKLVIVDAESRSSVETVRGELTDLRGVMVVDADAAPDERYQDLVEQAAATFQPADTSPHDPALLAYTSGTTGDPKGCLHGHRVALGHANLSYVLNYFQAGDRYYSPADWSWLAGIGNGMLGPWGFGVPVVASEARFDPQDLGALIDRTGVTVGLFTPTVLRLVRHSGGAPTRKLRCVVSGAELVTPEVVEWSLESFADAFNIGFGQTEANDIVGCVSAWEDPPLETLGRTLPGHRVEILDADDQPVAPGEIGEIALELEGNPVALMEYYKSPETTAAKFANGWLHTGDLGIADEAGYMRFVGRTDDMIKASGYRISPGEVEGCILQHPAVVECAAVGVEDAERGQIVKAFVQVRDDVHTDRRILVDEIKAAVRAGVGRHAYPREVEFVTEFPRTVTGKIRRAELRKI
jgi:acetyl-CoA synthetase